MDESQQDTNYKPHHAIVAFRTARRAARVIESEREGTFSRGNAFRLLSCSCWDSFIWIEDGHRLSHFSMSRVSALANNQVFRMFFAFFHSTLECSPDSRRFPDSPFARRRILIAHKPLTPHSSQFGPRLSGDCRVTGDSACDAV
jgi:hypothetical protein